MINGDKLLGRNQHCMAFVQGARSPSFRSSYRNAFAIVLALLGLGGFAHADPLQPSQGSQSGDMPQDVENYFAEWFDRVDATSAAQPSWAAPMATVTPLLKEFVVWPSLSDPSQRRRRRGL